MNGTVHIIGAGLAGMSAALKLAERGRKVVVHEATAFAFRGGSFILAAAFLEPVRATICRCCGYCGRRRARRSARSLPARVCSISAWSSRCFSPRSTSIRRRVPQD
jgi:glycine/D-amino acid oxidase-like deaminating enzyme